MSEIKTLSPDSFARGLVGIGSALTVRMVPNTFPNTFPNAESINARSYSYARKIYGGFTVDDLESYLMELVEDGDLGREITFMSDAALITTIFDKLRD